MLPANASFNETLPNYQVHIAQTHSQYINFRNRHFNMY